ncbi:MAG: hypothetical protein IJU39_06265 [Clostridia bacterium]|nr:hypothetical protein [Clostridia bacterium]
MKDYSYGEIAGMQMKALEEAREMSSRSGFPKEEKQQVNRPDCENCKNFDCNKNPSKRKGGLLSGIDDEKLLLIALLLILSKDQSDKSMLIALAYILM